VARTLNPEDWAERQSQILDAALRLLAREGIGGVSMRAVSREAGVALGLVGYYYDDKTSLIRAALERIGEQDLGILEPDPRLPPEEQLRATLRRVVEPEFLTTEYLSLRLQLWALAQAHDDFKKINTDVQQQYRNRLASLIRQARPHVPRAECLRRAADIDVLQNGMWLTALLGLDRASLRRSLRRCEEIAMEDWTRTRDPSSGLARTRHT
jgi:TetR/AcrR family transcriptional regulator, cholesterol catabolism regulator